MAVLSIEVTSIELFREKYAVRPFVLNWACLVFMLPLIENVVPR